MDENDTTTQEQNDTFKSEHFFECMDKNIASKEIRSNNRLPWITHKIRKMFKKKQKPNELISGTTINTSKKKSRSKSGKLNGHI